MADDHHICVVCAWRATCVKKFKDSVDLGAGKLKCPEYTRDVTIKDEGPAESRKGAGKPADSKKLWKW